MALFELLVLDEEEDPDSEPLELPLELFFFFRRLNSLGGGELVFFRLGADIGDGAFLTVGMRDRTAGECRLLIEELCELG